MKLRFTSLLIVLTLIITGLSFTTKAKASEFTNVKDAVTAHSNVYLFPGSEESKKARLYEVAEGIMTGFVILDNASTVNSIMDITFTTHVVNNSAISDLLQLSDEYIVFQGSDEELRSIIGETVLVEYTLMANNGSTADYSATVMFVEDAFGIECESEGLISEGESLSLTLFTGTNEYVSAAWSSSDTSIIEITQDELGKTAVITGKKQGTATISVKIKTDAQYETVTKDFTVNWKPGKAVLNLSKVTVYAGEKLQLLTSDLPENAKITFSSGKNSVATVTSKTGIITAKKAGTATITATVKVPATADTKAQTYKLKCKVTVMKAASVTEVSTLAELKSALTNGKGGKIRLIKDIENCNSTITIKSGSYRLDLNGHSIQGSGASKSGLIMVNGGTLNVIDSKNTGVMANLGGQETLGCIKGQLNIYGGCYAAIGYSLLIKGGTVKVYGGTFNGMSRAVNIYGGNLTIYGGSFNNTENFDDYPNLLYWDAITVAGGANSLVINGGSFTGLDCIDCSAQDAIITINHGRFEAGIQCLNLSKGTAVINGGTFIAATEDGDTFNVSPLFGTSTLTVNGGSFYGTMHNIFTQNESYIFINGGIFDRADLGGNCKVDIEKTQCGVVRIAAGVIPTYEINDETPSGQKLIATSFKKNSTVYKKGMTVTSPDDLYSVFTNACDNLYSHIEFYCNNDLEKIFRTYAVDEWIEGRHGSSNTSTVYDSEKKLYLIKIDFDYSVNYQLDKISENAKAVNNATKAAKTYSNSIDAILKSCITSGMTDKEKVTAIHDYMCKNYTYDYSFKDASYTVEGILDNKTGVCQAYALLFKSLCRRAGIECYTIEGIAGEPGNTNLHMWNCVVINGQELYCDVTFDDGAGTKKWLLKDAKTFYGYGYHY